MQTRHEEKAYISSCGWLLETYQHYAVSSEEVPCWDQFQRFAPLSAFFANSAKLMSLVLKREYSASPRVS